MTETEKSSTTPATFSRRHRETIAEFLIAFLLVASAVALYLGLSSDLVTVSKRVSWEIPFLDKEITFHEEEKSVSILSSVTTLRESGHAGLGWIILLFSIVLPVAKLTLAGTIHYGSRLFSAAVSDRLLTGLTLLGKWAILDVLVVALFIVLTRLGDFVTVTEHPGLYWFIGAVVLSKISIYTIQRLFHERRRTPAT